MSTYLSLGRVLYVWDFLGSFECVGNQVLLMFGPEYARSCGIDALEPLGIYLPGDANYPVTTPMK